MSDWTTLGHTSTDEEIKALLVGRMIVKAEYGCWPHPGQTWGDDATGKLTLDDGTEIFVAPNDGGCSCGAGDYDLQSLGTTANIITNARMEWVQADDQWGEGDQAYRIFVVTDAAEINAITITGNDGNGYYGTGFALRIFRPQAA